MGRHISRGERSMLEIFQDVSKDLQEDELFSWATFDRMFSGIRNTLKTELLDAINTAERSLNNPTAVKLLKILLLVKYVKDFKATAEHLKVLLVPGLDADLKKLGDETAKALNELEFQSYVERAGAEYRYLTNEEKDIEQEIKNTRVEVSEVRKNFYEDVMFLGVVKSSKIRSTVTGEDYAYKKAVDDEQPKVQAFADLAIRLITPEHPQYRDRNAVIHQASGKKELLVFIEPDERFLKDVRLHFQTRLYAQQSTGHGENRQFERIISEKLSQNRDRKDRLDEGLKKLIGEASLYVYDQELPISSGKPEERIVEAFQTLIAKSYPHLKMIQTKYTEQSLYRIMFPEDEDALFSGEAAVMDEAETEMWGHIQRKAGAGDRITLQSLLQEFTAGQYGWYQMAVLCVIAKLFKRNALEIREGASAKDAPEVHGILLKNRNLETYTVRSAPRIEESHVRRFKTLYLDLFHEEAKESSPKALALAFKGKLAALYESVARYRAMEGEYPFLASLTHAENLLKLWADKDWEMLIASSADLGKNLLPLKYDTVDPALAFMNGPQREIWTGIRDAMEKLSDNFLELKLEKRFRNWRGFSSAKRPIKITGSGRERLSWTNS